MNAQMKLKKLDIKGLSWGIFTCFVLFWYIYAPNLIYVPVSVDKLLLLGFFLWAVIWQRHELIKTVSNKDVFFLFAVYFVIFVYTFALDLIIVGGIGLSYHVSQYSLQYIPFSILLFLFMSSIYGEECLPTLFKFLLILVFLQSLLGLVMFIDPELKVSIYSIQAQDGIMYKGLITRGNGYASGLLFSVPILHGVMVATLLLSRLPMSILSKIVFVFIVTAVAITNARMALVPIIIAMPFLALRFSSLSGFISISKVLMAVTILGSLIVMLVPSNLISDDMLNSISKISTWLIGGYANVFGIEVSGNQELIADYLIHENSYVDDALIPLLFGTGEIAIAALKNQSDIGIINLIRFGGFFYLLSVLSATYYLVFKGWVKARYLRYRVLILLLGISYFAASLKGIVFTEQLLDRFLVLICMFPILDAIKHRSQNFVQPGR